MVSLDGRFLRTVRAVFLRPGRYLREYGRGVRSPYTPPVRLFLVMTFAFFLTLELTGRQIVVIQPEVALNDAGELDIREWAGGFFVRPHEVRYSAEERAAMIQAVRSGTASEAVTEEVLRQAYEEEATALRLRAEEAISAIRAAGGEDAAADIAEVRAELATDLADLEADLADDLADIDAARDGLMEGAGGLAEGAEALRAVPGGEAAARDMEEAAERMRQEAERGDLAAEPGDPVSEFARGVRAGMEGSQGGDGVVVGPGEGGLTIDGEVIDRERLTDALFRLAENPTLFNTALGDAIPRIMLLMVPLMALGGALFVRGRDALLYDHAILSLNTHAVAFGLMTLGLLTASIGLGGLFALAVFLGVPFYYARALRGAFGRSRRKVIVATGTVFTLYWLTLTTALTAAAIGAFADTL